MEAGALDVYTTPVHMKKNRPGVVLTALCRIEHIAVLEQVLFTETGTLGIRRWPVQRHVLRRRPHQVRTEWGSVDGKLARLGEGRMGFSPEYESCRQMAAETGCRFGRFTRRRTGAFDLSPPSPEW